MATASVTNTFVNTENADATEVNANFSDIVNFLNNTTVHDDGTNLQDALAGAWTTYTPTFSSSPGSFTLGNGTVGGRSRKLGRTVHFIAWHVAGSTSSKSTTTGDFWRCTLPYTAATIGVPTPCVMAKYETVNGGEIQESPAFIPSAGTYAQADTQGYFAGVGSGTGQVVMVSGTYEAAS